MAGWLIAALVIAADSNAVQAAASPHVRSDEASIRQLIDTGYGKSATFRAVIDGIDALSCVVYVASSASLSQGMEGALLHSTSGSRDMPVLRVHLKPNLARDRAIAVLAHELQHVAEAMAGLAQSQDATMSKIFDRLDQSHATTASKYETAAAQEVTDRVLRELRSR